MDRQPPRGRAGEPVFGFASSSDPWRAEDAVADAAGVIGLGRTKEMHRGEFRCLEGNAKGSEHHCRVARTADTAATFVAGTPIAAVWARNAIVMGDG